MATAQTVITRALKVLGVLSQGEAPSAEESADGLDALNDMLDSWSIDKLAVFNVLTTTHTLVVDTADYTVGSGGDISSIARPINILSGFIRDTNTNPVDYPLTILSQARFNLITVKTISSTIPLYLFYDPEFPLGIIKLWPVPRIAYTLHFDSVEPLTQFTGLSTSFSFPPGYLRAIVYNLAREMAAEFGVTPTMEVERIANDSLAKVKRLNTRLPVMQFDFNMAGRGGRYNIYRDL